MSACDSCEPVARVALGRVDERLPGDRVVAGVEMLHVGAEPVVEREHLGPAALHLLLPAPLAGTAPQAPTPPAPTTPSPPSTQGTALLPPELSVASEAPAAELPWQAELPETGRDCSPVTNDWIVLVTSLRVCCNCVLLASTESLATALAAPAQYCEEDALKLLPATTPTVSGESGASVRPICSKR